MFDETFYKVVASQHTAPLHSRHTVEFNLGHDILKAHFPDNPIVPGVCSLEIFRVFASSMLGAEVRIATVKNMKFVKLMTPAEGKRFDFDVDIKPTEDGRYSAKLLITEGDDIVSKASLICVKP
ncbi:MAG: hypothetical protein IJP95_09025 [Bacteroidales bacterium]|nr:hypothetical protein [Bacteroidales bacterium]